MLSGGLVLEDRAKTSVERAITYTFTDSALLEQALTHRSWVHENGGRTLHNERLELLGDAVLSVCVTLLLFGRFADAPAGVLSPLRARLANTTLAEIGRSLGLGAMLRLGKGEEKTGGREKSSLLAGATQAIVAAVLLDGGFDAASKVVNGLLGPHVEDANIAGKDPRARLQELTQQQRGVQPTYEVDSLEGPAHDSTFHVSVCLGEVRLGSGYGRSKREAAHHAALMALQHLERFGFPPNTPTVQREKPARRHEVAERTPSQRPACAAKHSDISENEPPENPPNGGQGVFATLRPAIEAHLRRELEEELETELAARRQELLASQTQLREEAEKLQQLRLEHLATTGLLAELRQQLDVCSHDLMVRRAELREAEDIRQRMVGQLHQAVTTLGGPPPIVKSELRAPTPIGSPITSCSQFIATGLAPILAAHDPAASVTTARLLHHALRGCRWTIVENPVWVNAYAQAMGGTAVVHWVQVEPTWLASTDAWKVVQPAWQFALDTPDVLVLVLLRDVDHALPEVWARPWLDVLAGLLEQLPFEGRLMWPANLRVVATRAGSSTRLPLSPEVVRHWAMVRSTIGSATAIEARPGHVPMEMWNSWLSGDQPPSEYRPIDSFVWSEWTLVWQSLISEGIEPEIAAGMAKRLRCEWPLGLAQVEP
jgi:ribonuclease-3